MARHNYIPNPRRAEPEPVDALVESLERDKHFRLIDATVTSRPWRLRQVRNARRQQRKVDSVRPRYLAAAILPFSASATPALSCENGDLLTVEQRPDRGKVIDAVGMPWFHDQLQIWAREHGKPAKPEVVIEKAPRVYDKDLKCWVYV